MGMMSRKRPLRIFQLVIVFVVMVSLKILLHLMVPLILVVAVVAAGAIGAGTFGPSRGNVPIGVLVFMLLSGLAVSIWKLEKVLDPEDSDVLDWILDRLGLIFDQNTLTDTDETRYDHHPFQIRSQLRNLLHMLLSIFLIWSGILGMVLLLIARDPLKEHGSQRMLAFLTSIAIFACGSVSLVFAIRKKRTLAELESNS